MKKIFMSILITILLLCLASGCIYVPYHRHIHRVPHEKTLASIKEGFTNKEDILLILGEPDRVKNNEKLFLYWWQAQYGGIEGLGGGAPVMRTYSLHIEFDENNVVRKCEIIERRMLDEFDEDSQ